MYRQPNRRELRHLREHSRFDRSFYLGCYADVAAAGLDPLDHFVAFGATEGRFPCPGIDLPVVPEGAERAAGQLHPVLQYLLDHPPAPVRRNRRGAPVRILLDTPRGVWRGENLGDVAMCAAAMMRFAALNHGVLLSVIVDDPAMLACAGVPFTAVPPGAKRAWLTDPRSDDARAFAEALTGADIVATTGHGALVDVIADDSIGMLRVLDAGIRKGAATAILGHGLGPFTDPRLRAVAAAVLPRVSLLCVREERDSPALLAGLGVAPHRVVVTGDDATRICIPPHVPPAPPDPRGLGLSLRLGYGMRPEALADIAALARRAAERERLSIVPLPIDDTDERTLGQLGHPCTLARQPAGFLSAAAGCRAVIAGSYHAAVFSLSQGIPTLLLSAGPFYRSKMSGLSRWFSSGSRLADFDAPVDIAALEESVAWLLARTPQDRGGLVHSALHQADLGDRAAARLLKLATSHPPAALLERLRRRLGA